ncbi:MAG: hypothetical protein ING19_06785 [Azospirillum sp.]|nr:hypothetical protein [Azospirillum sp.]
MTTLRGRLFSSEISISAPGSSEEANLPPSAIRQSTMSNEISAVSCREVFALSTFDARFLAASRKARRRSTSHFASPLDNAISAGISSIRLEISVAMSIDETFHRQCIKSGCFVNSFFV